MTQGNSAYRWYVLAILCLTYTFSFMDRQVLSIVLEDLREEFLLSDTQLGLLSGLAFALFYATLGVPIARLADRSNRVTIISCAVGLWSLMTALCGLANNFLQLFLCRIGVGVGEAGGTPPAHSIISDYFARSERSMALSLYSLGTALGALCGLALGGLIAQEYGWRMAFFVAGVPGIALALLVKATLREPERGRMDHGSAAAASVVEGHSQGMVQTIALLWRMPVYRFVAISSLMASFVSHSISTWLPSYFIRVHELPQGDAGLAVGLINLLGGVPGLLLGGWLGDRMSRRDVRWLGRIPALALALAIATVLGALWVPSYSVSAWLFGCSIFLYQLSHGPSLATIQWTLPPDMRAQGAAFVFFLGNILGLTFGPLLVGAVSDVMAQQLGDSALSMGLSIITLSLAGSSFFYWLTGTALARQEAP